MPSFFSGSAVAGGGAELLGFPAYNVQSQNRDVKVEQSRHSSLNRDQGSFVPNMDTHVLNQPHGSFGSRTNSGVDFNLDHLPSPGSFGLFGTPLIGASDSANVFPFPSPALQYNNPETIGMAGSYGIPSPSQDILQYLNPRNGMQNLTSYDVSSNRSGSTSKKGAPLDRTRSSASDLNGSQNAPSTIDPLEMGINSLDQPESRTQQSVTQRTKNHSIKNGHSQRVQQALNEASTSQVSANFINRNDLLSSHMPFLYSATGIDMLDIFQRVANRPNPKIRLGPVDLSCAFLLVDARRFDAPIAYASPSFCKLTGYTANEVHGRNCRFLQSPDGQVESGSERKHTEASTVALMAKSIAHHAEIQVSLINYRKGGQPFINLVTIIPVPAGDQEPAFFLGLQVDLVEQPNLIRQNILENNYIHTASPRAAYDAVDTEEDGDGQDREPDNEGSQSARPSMPKRKERQITNIHNDYSLTSTAQDSSSQRLLREAPDFILVLTPKGQITYVSPAIKKILEYEAQELVGRCLKDVAHPYDVVSALRELKDISGKAEQDIVLLLRIRRKFSGYIWLECQGRLNAETKSKKSFVLSARQRSMPSLSWDAIGKMGGLCARSFWLKSNVSGLIIYSSFGAESLLSQSPSFLGQSIYNYIPESHQHERQQIRQALNDAVSCDSSNDITMDVHFGESLVQLTVFHCQETEVNEDCSKSALLIYVKLHGESAISPWGYTAVGADNVFTNLDTSRSTSWQFELHQLKARNVQLRDEVRLFSTVLQTLDHDMVSNGTS